MKRLTARNKDGGAYYVGCFGDDAPCGGGPPGADCAFCPQSLRQCEKLAAYEDTGLEPEEIEPMNGQNDLISRSAARMIVENQCVDGKMYGNEEVEGTLADAYEIIDGILDLPAVTPPERTGRCYCQECENAIPSNDSDHALKCLHWQMDCSKNGFCNYGRKKEEAQDDE